MSRVRVSGVLATMAAVIILSGKLASAELTVISQNVNVDRTDKQVFFDVVFNQVPSWNAVDSVGRHVDSFQYEIVPNTRSSIENFSLADVRAVIRGDEIDAGKALVIRNGFQSGSDPSPASGGWGPVRGTVPFSIHGTEMKFAASFNMLDTIDGGFAYRLFTTNFGSTVSEVTGSSVPLPAALPAGLATLAALALGGLLRRRATQG